MWAKRLVMLVGRRKSLTFGQGQGHLDRRGEHFVVDEVHCDTVSERHSGLSLQLKERLYCSKSSR